MLSRVAERLYWLGRYIERAENTARLVMVNNNLLLDLPGSASALWESLLDLLADRPASASGITMYPSDR